MTPDTARKPVGSRSSGASSGPSRPDRSYRDLLGVPGLTRLIASMLAGRIAQSMVTIALVLFTLERYASPVLAGVVSFASVFPGLVVSPIAGALLDQRGRLRLVMLDYLVALTALSAIGTLAILNQLSPMLLISIAVVSSLTSILSHGGVRSALPTMVPETLWERINAVDSFGYIAGSTLGPPIVAGAVAWLGGPAALLIVAVAFGAAALPLIGLREPPYTRGSREPVLLAAWHGLRYTWLNPTLRGLAFAISFLTMTLGMTSIVIPVLVIQHLGAHEAWVGAILGGYGAGGAVSAFYFGRLDTRGREWILLVASLAGVGPAFVLLIIAANVASSAAAITILIVQSLLVGALNGPLDIAMFTVRQRRTAPSMMGRAFTVSMALNAVGMPVGAALAGVLVEQSVTATVLVLGTGAAGAATVAAALLIPREQPRVDA